MTYNATHDKKAYKTHNPYICAIVAFFVSLSIALGHVLLRMR